MKQREYKQQAKSTRYHKSFFRSRTEARWAVWMDAINLPYTYERQDTYLTTLQRRYLPDFYISSLCGQFPVEIKPKGIPSDLEIEKCAKLSKQTDDLSILLCGQPWFGDYNCHIFMPVYDYQECKLCHKIITDNSEFAICPNCGSRMWFGLYEPSKTVYHYPNITISDIPENGLIFLAANQWSLPLSQANIRYDNVKPLDFSFLIASRGRFEHLEHTYPKEIFMGEITVFNPAFQTQDWNEISLIYNALDGLVSFDIIKKWVNDGLDSYQFHNDYRKIINTLEVDNADFAKFCLLYNANMLKVFLECDWLIQIELDLIDFAISSWEEISKEIPSTFPTECIDTIAKLIVVSNYITFSIGQAFGGWEYQ